MLFNSFVFVFAFVPAVLVLFMAARRLLPVAGMLVCLLLASLLFYGYWNPVYLALLVPSMLVNYGFGVRLAQPGAGRQWLWVGVAANLLVLGYFKYKNFFLASLSTLTGTEGSLPPLVLPLAISFFTFQQIAFLVDVYQRRVAVPGLLPYMAFVSFFPQLIAGPIVHFQQLGAQFSSPQWRRFDQALFGLGLVLFALGLFKKVVLADQLALFANPVFDAAAQGQRPAALAAWLAMFSYSFQLYFDFSGYADMAIGLAALFGIRLPVNFNSPYKAHSIVDFWQRWHMTLSAFLRDYLYIALGGNRCGRWRRYRNLLLTMLLGGLWHGAGWTFVLWGLFHGVLLVLCHGLRGLWGWCPRPLAVGFTFLLVSLGWVLFRAESLAAAGVLYEALFGFGGMRAGVWAALSGAQLADIVYGRGVAVYLWLLLSLVVVWGLPGSWQWLGYRPDAGAAERRGVSFWQGLLAGVLLFCALNRMVAQPVSEFLYFNF